MKIAFVSQPLCSGGSERVVAALANAFDDLGHEVKIIVVDNGDENVYPTNDAIEFIHIDKPKNPVTDLFHRALRMRKFFSAYKPDIIIPFTTQKSVSALLAVLFTKHKVIACERNNPSEDPSNKFLRVLRKLLYWRADGFVFQTQQAKEYFSLKIQSRARVIFNPISSNIVEPWNGPRTKRIVMASRLYPQKNIAMAIDAMAEIAKKYPEYTLEIYGKGYQGQDEYEKKLLKQIADLNLQNNVMLKGFSSNLHLDIRDASVFLLTSDHEGMSNSLIEAMALGLPCISTDDPNGGARALISTGENGVLIPVGDKEACIRSLNILLGDAELRNRIANNAVKVREELSINRIANQWIGFILEVIKENDKKNNA